MITEAHKLQSAQIFLTLPKERQDLIDNFYNKLGKEILDFVRENKLVTAEIIVLLDTLSSKFYEALEDDYKEHIKKS